MNNIMNWYRAIKASEGRFLFRGNKIAQQNQPIHYEGVDPEYDDGNIAEQAYNLARNSTINILSDKELSAVAMSAETVVGALFTSIVNNSYSFDVVVDPSFQRSGIGSKLTDMAISEYRNLSFDMPDLQMNIDTVSPVMQKMLSDRGLTEKERVDDQRSMMGFAKE